MLELIIVVFVLMWIFGAFVIPVGGSAIHLLLLIVVVLVLVRLLRGERL